MTTQRCPSNEPGYERAASTGIEGLDHILRGGFPRDEMHLIQGASGTGKTTLALQYLLAGVRAGESGLYITLSQSKKGLEAIARSHGWSLDKVAVHELSPGGIAERVAAHQTVLHTSEIELEELIAEVRAVVEQVEPRRLVFDSLGVIGLLAGSPPRYRYEIVALRQFLAGRRCTALFVGDSMEEGESSANTEFHALAGSLLHLEQVTPDYGEVRRRVRVVKARTVPIEGGYHYFRIRTGGLEVYPRLTPYGAPEYSAFQTVQSGIVPLDKLLGGGLEQGTTCLFVGQPGVGKSTLAGVYVRAAAQRGDAVEIFLFDERPETWKARAKGVGMDLEPHLESGRMRLDLLDPVDISPGEFAQRVREAVEARRAKVVVIDSLTGYFNAMANTSMLVLQMHELLTFLSRHGVLTLLLLSQEGFMSAGPTPPLDVSYLSDSILVLRMFEIDGAVRRCIAAIKKRQGEHETTIRELFISPKGVSIGEEPLRQLRNILSGDPQLARVGSGPEWGAGEPGAR